jgi:hypothetical protein
MRPRPMDPAEGRQESPLRKGSPPHVGGNLETGRRRARLAMFGTLVALAVSVFVPTPLGFAAAAIILLGVCVVMGTIRYPQCGRRLGPITAFKYCRSCGSRIR